MKSKNIDSNRKYASIVILLALIVGAIYYYINSSNYTYQDESGVTNPATTTPVSSVIPAHPITPTKGTSGVDTSKYYSYANAEYNFSIKYPSYVQARNGFSTFHEIGNNWRLYAGPANQGKAVASFSIDNIDQGPYSTGFQSYPLYFTAEVRVGVSTNVKDCYAIDSGYTNQKVTNVAINGVTFKKFSTQDAAMMKYVQAESYRTIHNNMCFVLEQIRNGSSYRDEKMKPGVTDSTLTNYYNLGETIVKTFKFTK